MGALALVDLSHRDQLHWSYTSYLQRNKLMTVTEQLQDVVCDYLEKYPNISINALAKRSGVAATTIRRLVNQETKKSIAPHTVLNLVSSISKEKRLGKLIGMFDGPLGDLLKENFSAFAEEGGSSLDGSFDHRLNAVLADPIAYFVYKLTSNRTGIAEEMIQELYGRNGLNKLEELKELQLVEEKEGIFFATEKNFSLSVDIAAKHLPELMKYYKPGQIDLKRNMFYSLSESLSEEGIQKIKDIQKEAVKKTYQVMQSPFYEGNIPYFTVQVCDTLMPEMSEGVIQ
jgi:hypothetical protein